MLAIFMKTIPFFAIIALGYGATRWRMFENATIAALTKFVFYFALSAMIFRFAANMAFSDVLNWPFLGAYLSACLFVYAISTIVSLARKQSVEVAAIEAQCAVIGNVGFLGLPMLALLLGQEAIIWNMLVLIVDLCFFGSLVVILITGSRDGRVSLGILRTVFVGLLKNPMIMAMVAGLIWSSTGWTMPTPVDEFTALLGAAATPCALFVIGASLAGKSAERLSVAGWLSFCKLVLHPAAVAVSALWIFGIEPYAAGVMIAAAALPVAGNVYIVAQSYGAAAQRASAAILVSTVISIFTLSAVVGWVSGF